MSPYDIFFIIFLASVSIFMISMSVYLFYTIVSDFRSSGFRPEMIVVAIAGWICLLLAFGPWSIVFIP